MSKNKTARATGKKKTRTARTAAARPRLAPKTTARRMQKASSGLGPKTSSHRVQKKAVLSNRAAARKQALPSHHIQEEGLAQFCAPEGVFFNPHMHRCRDLSSLWVGTRPRIEKALDGFCASGARGLRYILENDNVGSVTFLDLSQTAIDTAKSNVRLNKIKPSRVGFVREDIGRFLLDRSDFDLMEIDPFGSPGPHLHALMHAGYNLKERYVSITATDMAVLCGAHAPACWKNYGAKPMDNEFCHENALRILLGRVARAAAEENWSVEPQFCYSHRHYLKLLLKLTKGADGAVACAKLSMKYAVHCPKCLYHGIEKFPIKKCPQCANDNMDWAGPLWGGAWADANVVKEMMAKLRERDYLEADELTPILQTILDELPGPALYYDLHELCSKHNRLIPRNEDMIAGLQKAGYFASRTHFSTTAIRTDAPLEEIISRMTKHR